MKPFVVVYGAPRTGTSLTMDIVQAAGFNAGQCYSPPKNPRRGRNEHRLFGQPLSNWKPSRVLQIIQDEEISCAKVIGYPEWIDFLSEHFDVRIVATHRDNLTRTQSAVDMLVHLKTTQEKIGVQRRILRQRNEYLRDTDLPTHNVDFGKLVTKDLDEFTSLAHFLGANGLAHLLMEPVDPTKVKFRSNNESEAQV